MKMPAARVKCISGRLPFGGSMLPPGKSLWLSLQVGGRWGPGAIAWIPPWSSQSSSQWLISSPTVALPGQWLSCFLPSMEWAPQTDYRPRPLIREVNTEVVPFHNLHFLTFLQFRHSWVPWRVFKNEHICLELKLKPKNSSCGLEVLSVIFCCSNPIARWIHGSVSRQTRAVCN